MRSASARRAGPAPDSTAPRPPIRTGRSAAVSSAARASSAAGAGWAGVGCVPGCRVRAGRALGFRPGGARRPRRSASSAGTARLHVERHHQHDRAPLDPRPADGARGVRDGGRRAVHPLRDRPDGADERVLLDAEVGADRRRGRVGGDEDDGRPALRRLGEPRDRVGQPGALVDAARGDPAADARVAVGHADRAALVPRGVEGRAGVAEVVREGEVPAPHDAEHDLDPLAGERPADCLRHQHRRIVWGGCGRW